CAARAHDKEGTRVDVSAPHWSPYDWSAPEVTRKLPADQSGADTSTLVSPYHVPLGHILEKPFLHVLFKILLSLN
ncbi:hypothetical protein Tco_1271334, partial [Tanacetum coccineum]